MSLAEMKDMSFHFTQNSKTLGIVSALSSTADLSGTKGQKSSLSLQFYYLSNES